MRRAALVAAFVVDAAAWRGGARQAALGELAALAAMQSAPPPNSSGWRAAG